MVRVQAMTSIKDLDSTAIYAYTTLISVLICVPAAQSSRGPTCAQLPRRRLRRTLTSTCPSSWLACCTTCTTRCDPSCLRLGCQPGRRRAGLPPCQPQ